MSVEPPPIPEPDINSVPFFEGLAEGRLLVQICGRCGTAQLGHPDCDACGHAALEWQPASGRGTIYSFTRMHLSYHPAFADLVPYFAGIVALEEGPLLYGRFVVAEGTKVAIGQPVVAEIVHFEGAGAFPIFTTVTESQA